MDTEALRVLGNMLMGMVGVITILLIIDIVASWVILTKAGEPGWKALIPIYSSYMLYKVAWDTKYFWVTFVLGGASSAVSGALSGGSENGVLMALSIIIGIFAAVLSVMYAINLSRRFGHDAGFAIGLLLLPQVFKCIIAFGSSQYHPEAPTLGISFIDNI